MNNIDSRLVLKKISASKEKLLKCIALSGYMFSVILVLGAMVISQELMGQKKKVAIGYQGLVNPWKHAINKKTIEKATGYDIAWQRFDSGSSVISAMASGDLQLGVSGSSGIASAMSRGLPVELFWVLEDIADAEALVVRKGAGIITPQDLKGKTIGVPFAATTHFHLLFALEQFKIPEKSVKILNMQPNAIASAWSSGTIDAAFVWDPALGKIKKSGDVLITSGLLNSWGKATFDGVMVNAQWGKQNKDFMVKLVKIIDEIDSSYKKDPSAWSPRSPMVASIVKLSGADAKSVPATLALYKFLSLKEQASPAWLGGGKNSGAARALKFTSEFLKSQKKLPTVQKDYSKFVNPQYVQAALK
ncbi:taurine-binding periplasmic protein [Spirochaetota bacterium]|nr:taurine-binding periplasmic protein [Spirochaetota bacterium]